MKSSRREFLVTTAAFAAGAAAGPWARLNAKTTDASLPWYRRTLRWGQTNLNELDPQRFDLAWWREQWRRTRTQGIVVNAGGIVAYYPTEVPGQRRAKFLGNRDLFGEICQAAKEEGIVVSARMDSGGLAEELYHSHPDWFARTADGKPILSRDLYLPCLNGPYYATYMAAIIKEIVARYHPAGFTDNMWSGVTRESICHCDNCRQQFRAARNLDLPAEKNWSDPAYRAWIEWSYDCRIKVWDDNNRLTRSIGGPDCIWVGMLGGSPYGASTQFRDFRRICQRADMVMFDDQRRINDEGFPHIGEAGKLIHGVMGWDKVASDSMAMYGTTDPTLRLSARPAPEARLWMIEGIAGGLNPWWHYIGAYGEDRRMYRTPVELCQWHAAHEDCFVNRRPVATVGLLWSQRSSDFYGRDDWKEQALRPMEGFTQALIKARIPYLPIHIDDLDDQGAGLRTLIAPNLGALADAQTDSIRRFVAGGGGLVATGYTGMSDSWGDPRSDFALADVLGVSLPAQHGARQESNRHRWAVQEDQTYLRLTPELRARMDGPHPAGEPTAAGARHPVLAGFDETDILAFGGMLESVVLAATAQALATFVPPVPIAPPEDVYMRAPKTEIPGVVIHAQPGKGRVVTLLADLDRRYARNNMPDHARLLANAVRWTAQDNIPVQIEGAGLIDCHFYRQSGRLLLHVINLTNAGTWRAPIDEFIPVGPLKIRVQLRDGIAGKRVDLLVAGHRADARSSDGWTEWAIPSLLEHELAVIS